MITRKHFNHFNHNFYLVCTVKSPCSHKETWWWNEEVTEAVNEKKKSMKNLKEEKLTEAWKEYKKSIQNTKRVTSIAKGKKQKECANDLNDPNHQNEIL